MKRYLELSLALLLDVVGAGGALLIAARTWQTITTPRAAPLGNDVLSVPGRSVDAVPTALAFVALAGVVAVLATRGVVRRAVGAIVALAGVGVVWRAVLSAGAVSTARARALVLDHHPTVDVDSVVPRVATHGAWPVLTVACGVLVAAGGALVAARGHRWRGMSARYDSGPGAGTGANADPARAAASLWSALDRGEDPTG